jgi:two-component system chemotaxis response regulator CheY
MSKTILIADDSASVRQIVGMVLKSKGFKVIEAVNGKDALSKLTGQKINLILSDVNMPEMDGLSFVAAVKSLPDYKFTPVLMLTTESSDEVKSKGRELGVKAWLVKPFQPQVLLSAISKLT